MPFSRQDNVEFVAFKQFVNDALKDNPNLFRLDCLNPIKAIKHEFDFTHNPDIGIKEAWEQFLGFPIHNCAYSYGVRDSLGHIFKQLKEIAIPNDVYPVYQKMADSIGLKYKTYSTLPRFDILDALSTHHRSNNVLLTFPLVPSGRDITEQEVKILLSWLQKDKSRLVIIDRVYDYNRNPIVKELIESNQVIVLYSLSKTFLSPNEMGLAILPSHIKIHSNEFREDHLHYLAAKILLTKYKNFPAEQQSIFRYRWSKIFPGTAIADRLPQHPHLINGYLSVVRENYKDLLAKGILAIPGNVYGTSDRLSIISCLHETNSRNDTDVVKRRYVTVLSNFAKGYDKYGRTYSKANITESTFPDKFFLLNEDLTVGFEKGKRLLGKTVDGDKLIIIETCVKNHELHPHRVGEYITRNYLDVNGIFDENLKEIPIENAYADSLNLNKLHDWKDVKPRSLSVLPIAQACQARCDFCFSHSSVSDDQRQGKVVLENLSAICERSKSLGAERLVITGGGEPTLMLHDNLLKIMQIGKKHFDKIVMITNGYNLGNNPKRREILQSYAEAGLTVLSLSRHSHDKNEKIMKLDTKSDLIAKDIGNIPLTLRWVCVLQKGGVEDDKTLCEYLDWVVDTGVKEICFKELYVAVNTESEYYNSTYNVWSKEHQVPMKLIVDFLVSNNGKEVARLPWGAPIYNLRWKGQLLKIAVYTEPSVFWERSEGICRSWNLMADGTCYANLETKDSQINVGGRLALI